MILDDILKHLFISFHNITESYGLSIILLSLSVSIIMLPLFWIAKKIKLKDDSRKAKMQTDLDKISALTNKQEKYFYTKEIYKKHHYHPLYSLVGLIGLAIQLPFFIAAFKMLGEFTAFDGIPFGPINNLFIPDQLLIVDKAKVNLLPFIMTSINILSSFLFSNTSDKKDKIQSIFISLFFLIILYSQSSALLLYWTINNILTIPKNWILLNILNTGNYKHKTRNVKATVNTLKKHLLTNKTIVINILFVCIIYTAIQSLYVTLFIIPKLYFICFILVSIVYFSTITFLTIHQRKSSSPSNRQRFFLILSAGLLIVTWYYILESLVYLTTTILNNSYSPLVRNKCANYIYLISIISIFFFIKEAITYYKLYNNKFHNSSKLSLIGVLSIFYIVTLVFFEIPAEIYHSSPSEIDYSLYTILAKNILTALSVLIPTLIIIIYSQSFFKHFITAIILSILIFIILNGIIFPRTIGILYQFTFRDTNIIPNDPIRNLVEISFILFSLYLAFKLILNHQKTLLVILIVTNISIYGQLSFNLLRSKAIHKDLEKINNNNLKKVMSYSKDGKNIVVLILDMFVGSHLENIIKNDSSIIKDLNGFAWYPNTLSASNMTNTSVPVLNAGWDYTPENLNKRKGVRIEKITQSYEKMVSGMQNNDYNVSIIEPIYYKTFHGNTSELTKLGVNVASAKDFLDANIKSTNSIDANLYSKILTKVGLFSISPSIIKSPLYDFGRWGVLSQTNYSKGTIANRVFMEKLSTINNTNSPRNTFKRFHSFMPHEPFCVNMSFIREQLKLNSQTLNDLKNRDQYYLAALTSLHLTINWIKWLKKETIFNNTKIIIVSDHGRSIKLNKNNGKKHTLKSDYKNMIHPLLLVKEFNDSLKFTIKNNFMSNADVPAIIASSLKKPTLLTYDIDYTKIIDTNRVLPSYTNINGHWKKISKDEKISYTKYEVTKSIFNDSNWKKVKDFKE